MENWMWISLYVVQTLVGAVFYRIYFNDVEESTEDCLLMTFFKKTSFTWLFRAGRDWKNKTNN